MKLLVIGAGLSGLVTAIEVQSAGHEVIVLEAQGRVGGRILTLREGLSDGQFADVGAEIIYQGQDNLIRLCERFGLELSQELSLGPGVPTLIFGGQRLSEGAAQELAAEIQAAMQHTRPGHYETIAQWLRRAHVSQQAELLLTAIAQSTPAGPLRIADAEELNADISWGEGYRKIVGGNDLLPRAIARELDIRLGQAARIIGWGRHGVTVETDRATFRGDRVAITVPGPLVPELGFDPVLPADKVQALLQLRYGNATRIVAQYAERELLKGAIGPGCFTDRIPGFIMDQSIHQTGDKIVVGGLAAGDSEPVGQRDEELLDQLDATLSSAAGRPVKRIFGTVKSWTRDPWSRAVVRALIGDQRQSVLPTITAPLDGRVFFAGEHTDERVGPGGMEGAIRSAYRVSKQILAEA